MATNPGSVATNSVVCDGGSLCRDPNENTRPLTSVSSDPTVAKSLMPFTADLSGLRVVVEGAFAPECQLRPHGRCASNIGEIVTIETFDITATELDCEVLLTRSTCLRHAFCNGCEGRADFVA